jgi:hypothetical protein
MITNTKQTAVPTSRERDAVKRTEVAVASVCVPIPAKPQKAAPSHTAIAEKAYEIWVSMGQVLGRDQEYWFEAERQLQQA